MKKETTINLKINNQITDDMGCPVNNSETNLQFSNLGDLARMLQLAGIQANPEFVIQLEQAKYDSANNPVTKLGKKTSVDPYKIRGTAQIPNRITNTHGDN